MSTSQAVDHTVTHAPDSMLGIRVAMVILRRELIRFLRQPSRIGAAIGTPVILWLFMSSGFAGSMSASASSLVESGSKTGAHEMAGNYALYLLPGMMTLVAMFTAIFSSISIIEDRQEGWLQSVLVSPAPRWSIAAGKVLGGSILAFGQAVILLFALPFLAGWPGAIPIVQCIIALVVTCIAMTGVGVAFAWVSESTQGFHAVMNLVLMPLWLLSGAFFSTASAAHWLAIIMYINPLTWATAAIRSPLVTAFGVGPGGPAGSAGGASQANAGAEGFIEMLNHPSWWLATGVACVFAVVMFAIATWIVARPRKTAH